MSGNRGVYRRAELARLFEPASIAIVGASPNPTAFGARQLANLSGYGGRIHLVNGRYDTIGGRPCHPTLSDLPEVPDLTILCVNRDLSVPLVEEAAALGIGGAIVFASGFAETGRDEHSALQARLAAIARSSDLRILGPNVIGFIDFWNKAYCAFTMGLPESHRSDHAIALVGQSGAVAMSALQSAKHGVSISHAITCGNSVDVDVADGLAYLVEKPECKSIVLMVEGVASADRLVEAAELAAKASKPVVVFKLATGETGNEAALSHTGSLAGSTEAFNALAKRSGMLPVTRHEAMIETAAFLAKAPAPKADGVALLTNSGGVGIMMADWADAHQVGLPQPSEETRKSIQKHVPEYASVANPCDVTATVTANVATFEACARALLSDTNFAGLVVPNVFVAAGVADRQHVIGRVGKELGKPVFILWCSNWWEGEGAIATEQDPNLSVFRSSDTLFRAFKLWQRWHAFQAERLSGTKMERLSPASALPLARRILTGSQTSALTEREAKQLLAAYGLPVVSDAVVQNEDEAALAGAKTGYPVVLKLESPDILHKTEAGVVRLNLRDESSLRNGYREIMANAAKISPPPKISGVLVQAMIPAGLEVVVGCRCDPIFGPLVLVGLGGIFVELLRDTTTALAPVNRKEALALLSQLKGAKLFDGFRGSEAIDRNALADIVVRASELADDLRDAVQEIDINPLICSGQRIVAVDALITRAKSVAPVPGPSIAENAVR